MSAWGAGLGPLSGDVGAMQTYVIFPGLQLVPAEPDIAGEGPWANPNLRKGDKHQYKHIPSQGALCPQSHPCDLGGQQHPLPSQTPVSQKWQEPC